MDYGTISERASARRAQQLLFLCESMARRRLIPIGNIDAPQCYSLHRSIRILIVY